MAISAEDIKVYLPQAGTTVAISSTSTAAQDLGVGTQRVAISCTSAFYLRAGDANVSAAVTTDTPFEATKVYVLDVHPGVRYFRAIRQTADGTLTWSKVA